VQHNSGEGPSVAELSGYVLETLREDGGTVLYRGRQSGNAVPILVLAPTTVRQAVANTTRLEHEYTLADKLESAWAARPLALARHDGRTVLILEDPGGYPLEASLGGPAETTYFLQVAVGLAAALRQVHQRGLLHHDIKPANLLVDATGNVRITGFGMASLLPSHRRAVAPSEFISGTLAYMAPEQTGRMNRAVDARSDLYSLGITLYEMLTGTLPFAAADPIEWMHCHIARPPTPLGELVKGVPAPVEAIILKLLAKNAEDRYQTAAGVEVDLQRCLVALEKHGRIDPFELARHDGSDRLLVSGKLYGREAEVSELIAAFVRAATIGKTELVLVSGEAGIGKSSIVGQLGKVLDPSRGFFAAGKFDQYLRDIPYATLAQASQSLIRQLLGKDEAELGRWRNVLQETLGANGQLIVNLIPELALIVGEQRPVPDLAPRDAQNRFQSVFCRFLGVFARSDQPLVLFLDDLQWVDAATLELIERLATDPQVRNVVLVCAYREREVGDSHPMLPKLEAIRHAKGRIRRIPLVSLTSADVGQIVADALHADPADVKPLADLVFAKVGGNPLFVIQFTAALVDEGLLAFDAKNARWRWDVDRIGAKNLADNMAGLLAAKLGRLTAETQEALGLLACLGNVAEVATVASVCGRSDDDVHAALREAVEVGVVLRVNGSYRFLHDRLQEAAYALIPDGERLAAHLRIGRALAARMTPNESDESVFEIVNQLDRGASRIQAREERERLAELNLVAGRRAKASTAYASARTYFAAGRALLGPDCWERQYRLIFDLELNRSECEFMIGEYVAAEEQLAALAARASNFTDRAAVTCLRISLQTLLDHTDRAIEIGLDYLNHVGIDWAPHPADEIADAELDRMMELLAGRPIEDLIDLPYMSDLRWRSTMDVLAELLPPALFTDRTLHDLILVRMANLSLEHGNCDASCYAYSSLIIVLSHRLGDYKSGLRFGQLACDLVDSRGLTRFKARVYACFATFVVPWTKHLPTSRPLTTRPVDTARTVGDLTYIIYSSRSLVASDLAAGEKLDDVQRQAEQALTFARNTRFGLVAVSFMAQLMLIRELRGLHAEAVSLDGVAEEDGALERYLERGGARTALARSQYWINRIQTHFFAQDYAASLQAMAKAASLLPVRRGFLEVADYHFYAALTEAAVYSTAAADERRQRLEKLAGHQVEIAAWARNCPENFADRAALAGAEIARLQGRELEAEHLYDMAIRSAREYGFVQNEAIANELAARFHAARGLETIAIGHLVRARACYQRWGADGKVRQLDRDHPRLGEQVTLPASDVGPNPVAQLDVGAMVKASQALSGEIVLDSLIETLMRLAVEHAGADRGILILVRNNDTRIAAEAAIWRGRVEVTLREAAVSRADFPNAALNYVTRTGKSLILGDAATGTLLLEDDYLRRHRPRSMLCLPIAKQARLVGALYLENKLTPYAFLPDRIALLEFLASQAAISLDNAYLYADLQRSEAFLAEGQRLSHAGSWSWNVVTGQVVWSDEHYRIFGLDPKTTVATFDLFLQTVHPDDRVLVQSRLNAAIRDRTGFSFEFRLARPDGSVGHVHGVGRPIVDETGKLQQYLGTTMDVSERKLAEDALRHAQANLVHVARLTTMGELTASIAHEVNQPLMAIVTNAETCLLWLTRNQPNLEEARGAVQRIVGNSQRASEVIKRVRALARKATPEMARLDINDVIDEVLDMLRAELRRHDVSLVTRLAIGLGPIMGDRVQLQQVVMNLIMNAIEAMGAVTDRLRTLRVTSQAHDNDEVLVTVEDSGTGFAPDAEKHLFDSFYTTKRDGLGLGLSICRTIITDHGGRLWASSNSPDGAVISFTLQAATDES
jgi:PAS domain S-box-containing protein